MEGGKSLHQKDSRRRIILAPYIFCIQFTCKTTRYFSLALGSSSCFHSEELILVLGTNHTKQRWVVQRVIFNSFPNVNYTESKFLHLKYTQLNVFPPSKIFLLLRPSSLDVKSTYITLEWTRERYHGLR